MTWFSRDKSGVFADIQPLLVQAIPEAFRGLQVDSPLCIVRIYYYDTHAPLAYVDLRYVTISKREELRKKHEAGFQEDLWCSYQEPGQRLPLCIPADPPSTAADVQLTESFAEIYQTLSKNERKGMKRLRAALRSVAKELNESDWSTVCDVSDDFVVAPADGSMFFCDDKADLIESIPSARIESLQAAGWLGTGNDLIVAVPATHGETHGEDDEADAPTESESICREIRTAVKRGDVDEARQLLESHRELRDSDFGLGGWLLLAASKESLDMIRMLADLGCDVNKAYHLGSAVRTPLLNAIRANNVENTELLLSLGADPNAHETIIDAIRFCDRALEVVKLLDHHGVELHAVFTDNATGKTLNALSTAIECDQPEVAEYLRSRGCNLPT